MKITPSMSWKERSKFIKSISGGEWFHNKTGKKVKVLGHQGYLVKLLHKSGRITYKQDHYFIGDYSNEKD